MTAFRFNNDTLRVESVVLSRQNKLQRGLLYALGVLTLSFITAYSLRSYTPTPEQLEIRERISTLTANINQLNGQLDEVNALLVLKQSTNNFLEVVFNEDITPQDIYDAGFGGVEVQSELKGVSPYSSLVEETENKANVLEKQVSILKDRYTKLADVSADRELMMATTPAIFPIDFSTYSRITDGYGMRNKHPVTGKRAMHDGVDIAAPAGSPIYATADGVVTLARYSGAYGKLVKIKHSSLYETRYAHMHDYIVKPGQKVRRGDVIGHVGSTGRSTGPHLHYEVRMGNNTKNPYYFYYRDIDATEYKTLLAENAETALD